MKRRKESKQAIEAKKWLKTQTVKFTLALAMILIVNLFRAVLFHYMFKLSNGKGRYFITFIGMALAAFIFYALLKNMGRISKFVVEKIVRAGKEYMGRRKGFYISISVLYVLMFAAYYWVWFDRNFFVDVWRDLT
ncbi:MAG: hypothetical protein JW812_00005 [Alphaproteobacteria bacterium]|nr:hypothetical protein [Alphaproteobacteria bacterium]MBN2779863.1 hypothetical protein [Alphaproteobacteria bacterium]